LPIRLRKNGLRRADVISNAEVGEPRERLIGSMRFPGTPVMARCSKARTKAPISDQFECSYLGSDPPGDAVFKIRLHQDLIVASAVICSPSKAAEIHSPERRVIAGVVGVTNRAIS
jgi:hypothetical protein